MIILFYWKIEPADMISFRFRYYGKLYELEGQLISTEVFNAEPNKLLKDDGKFSISIFKIKNRSRRIRILKLDLTV